MVVADWTSAAAPKRRRNGQPGTFGEDSWTSAFRYPGVASASALTANGKDWETQIFI